jgi:hypothetical protein
MRAVLPCLTCGFEGRAGVEVVWSLVELPEAEQRPVMIDGETVPERFVTQPRCKDRKACDERVAAYRLAQHAVPPEQPIDEEYQL